MALQHDSHKVTPDWWHFGGFDPVGDCEHSIDFLTFPMISPLKIHYEGLRVKHVRQLELQGCTFVRYVLGLHNRL